MGGGGGGAEGFLERLQVTSRGIDPSCPGVIKGDILVNGHPKDQASWARVVG